jgi:hypothetical protein
MTAGDNMDRSTYIIDVARKLNEVLRKHRIEPIDYPIKPEGLGRVIQSIVGANRTVRITGDFFAQAELEQRWKSSSLAQEVVETLRGYSPQAQGYVALYLLATVFAEHTHIEKTRNGIPIGDNEDSENLFESGFQYRMGSKLAWKEGHEIMESEAPTDVRRATTVMSLPDVQQLARTYQDLPHAQGLVLACVGDWAKKDASRHEVDAIFKEWEQTAHRRSREQQREMTLQNIVMGGTISTNRYEQVKALQEVYLAVKVARTLQSESVKVLVERMYHSGMDPTKAIYCLGQVAQGHTNPEEAAKAARLAIQYLNVSSVEGPLGTITGVDMLLHYVADVFERYNKEGDMVDADVANKRLQQEGRNKEVQIFQEENEAAYGRVLEAFSGSRELIHRIRDIDARDIWMGAVQSCAVGYTDWQEPLADAQKIFNAHYEKRTLGVAFELFGRGVEYKRTRRMKEYLTSDAVLEVASLSAERTQRMFKDRSVNRLCHPEPYQRRGWSSDQHHQAQLATILYGTGEHVTFGSNQPQTAIKRIETLLGQHK